MGKVAKIAAAVGGLAVAFVPGVGPALTGLLYGSLTGGAVGVGAAAVLGAAGALTQLVGVLGVTAAFGLGAKALGLGPKQPKINRASAERLNATVEPSASRKLAFGETAMPVDMVLRS